MIEPFKERKAVSSALQTLLRVSRSSVLSFFPFFENKMESSPFLLSAIPYYEGRRYKISGGLFLNYVFFLCKYTIKNQKDNPYVSGFSLYSQQPVSHKAKSINVMNRMGFIIRMGIYGFK